MILPTEATSYHPLQYLNSACLFFVIPGTTNPPVSQNLSHRPLLQNEGLVSLALVVLSTTHPPAVTTSTRTEPLVTLLQVPLLEASSHVVALPMISPIALSGGRASKNHLSSPLDKRSETQRTRSVWQMTLLGELVVPVEMPGIMSVSLRTRRLKSEFVFDCVQPLQMSLLLTADILQRASCQVETEGSESRRKEYQKPRTIRSLKPKGNTIFPNSQ